MSGDKVDSLAGKLVIKAQLGQDIRRIAILNEDITYDELILMMQRVFRGSLSTQDQITLKYKDEDDDLVTIVDNCDVAQAILCSRVLRLRVIVQDEASDSMNSVENLRAELVEISQKLQQLLDKTFLLPAKQNSKDVANLKAIIDGVAKVNGDMSMSSPAGSSSDVKSTIGPKSGSDQQIPPSSTISNVSAAFCSPPLAGPCVLGDEFLPKPTLQAQNQPPPSFQTTNVMPQMRSSPADRSTPQSQIGSSFDQFNQVPPEQKFTPTPPPPQQVQPLNQTQDHGSPMPTATHNLSGFSQFSPPAQLPPQQQPQQQMHQGPPTSCGPVNQGVASLFSQNVGGMQPPRMAHVAPQGYIAPPPTSQPQQQMQQHPQYMGYAPPPTSSMGQMPTGAQPPAANHGPPLQKPMTSMSPGPSQQQSQVHPGPPGPPPTMPPQFIHGSASPGAPGNPYARGVNQYARYAPPPPSGNTY